MTELEAVEEQALALRIPQVQADPDAKVACNDLMQRLRSDAEAVVNFV